MPYSDREPGATFAPDQIGWLDWETKTATVDIKSGTYAYALDANAVILSYALGDGPERVIVTPEFPRSLTTSDIPQDFHQHHLRVQQGQAVWAAWNCGFDKTIWNVCTDLPWMEPHHIIDPMVQATVSGLAPDLAQAAKQSKSIHKVADGKALIKLFCNPGATATPQSHPEEWKQFCGYAGGDILAMRSVFKHTRQLTMAEWKEFWAAERVNERGVAIDLDMVRHAATMADEDKRRSRAEIFKLTNGAVETVDQVKRMTGWLLDRLPPAGCKILTKREEEKDDDGVLIKPAKHQLTRKQVQRLIALCATDPKLATEERLLQIRLYGGSKSPAKYSRMLQQQVDGVLMGQYSFNGAPQTGRFSSKGPQVHNLTRDALAEEPDLIEALLRQCNYDHLAALGSDTPVARKLALLVRPALVPEKDRIFVISDLAQVEARITPFLAGDEPGALERLQIFREVDADPSLPDLYTRTAAGLAGIPIEQVTKPIRQIGKIAELALQFLGGTGALQGMAANYNVFFTDAEAKKIVDDWRGLNSWAIDFGDALWDAANSAIEWPGVPQTAGRITYIFLKNYLGGSLLCVLPSGRVITYRDIRYERLEDLDDDDQPTGKYSTHLRCARGYGRVKIWKGIFVENVTQGTAADFLRGALVQLEDENFRTRLHTHDEVGVECELRDADRTEAAVRDIMRAGYDWSRGMPLMSEETLMYYYTKHEKSWGL